MNKLKSAFVFIAILWIIHFADVFFNLGLNRFGILPRTQQGLIGIVASPFLHANLYHLISNTITLFILLLTLKIFYPRIATKVIITTILLSGSMVWLMARPAIHIGASSLIYSLAGFLVFMGIFRRSFKALIIALLVAFFYGGLIWGIFPTNPQISFEGHLFGAVAGIIVAYANRNRRVD